MDKRIKKKHIKIKKCPKCEDGLMVTKVWYKYAVMSPEQCDKCFGSGFIIVMKRDGLEKMVGSVRFHD